MIEATCTACGNVNRVSDADIPVGARFVTCVTCKARVAIPTKTGAMAAVLPPGIDAAAPGAAQAAAAALEGLDLADLP
ncbi:MAG: hypothetical protein KIT31_26530, partial [Deltaproteobacteria bacterium]|nr:hypothetical protein [Deltaproteobacteria bacterium]